MGFTSTAVAAILLAFGLGAAGYLGSIALEGQRDLAAAGRDQGEHLKAERAGALEVTNRDYKNGPKTLELWVDNTGGQTFDAAAVDVLLDGALGSGLIAQRKVDNDPTTDVWAPGEELYLKLDNVASNPARAWVVADTGVAGVG